MKKIIFLGGSKGVGKTSLAKEIAKTIGFDYINTGDRFRKYRLKFNELFAEEIMDSSENLLIDTHYAVSSSKTPYDFDIGLNEESLSRIGRDKEDRGGIYLITASPETILFRRVKDSDSRRSLDIFQIVKENDFNNIYSSIYSSCLGFPKHVFINENILLEEAIDKLSRKIQK